MKIAKLGKLAGVSQAKHLQYPTSPGVITTIGSNGFMPAKCLRNLAGILIC